MPFLENLVEGLSNAAGSDTGKKIEQLKADRKATQHEELEGKTKGILDDVKNLQARRAALPAGDPGIADIDKSLAEHQQAFRDLYHPIKNPGNLQKLGGFLQQHLTGKAPKPAPKSNEVTPERMAGLEASAAGTQQNPYELKKRALMATGVAEDEATRLATGQKDQKPAHESDYAQGLKRFVKAEGGDPENPTAEEEQAFRKQRAADGHAGTSKFSQEAAVYEKQWGKKIGEWTPEELTYFNQKMAYDAQRNGQSTTTKLEKDQDNNIVPVEVTTTHGPMAAPVDPHAPKVPASPGEAKSRVKVHAPLPFKAPSADVTAAKKSWEGAVQLASLADQVAQHPDDAVNVKGFAIALERARANRFTTQALDVMLDAGWANKLEQWANKPSSGTLPRDVLRQLVEGAHQNVKATKDAWDAARGPSTPTPTSKSSGAPAGGGNDPLGIR